MNAVYAIPYTVPVAPAPAGLFNLPATDWASWVMLTLCAVAAIWLMPGQVRTSLASLWAPVGAWIGRLRVAVAGIGVFIVLGLVAPLRAILAVLWFIVDLRVDAERLVREGFPGFLPPVTT